MGRVNVILTPFISLCNFTHTLMPGWGLIWLRGWLGFRDIMLVNPIYEEANPIFIKKVCQNVR